MDKIRITIPKGDRTNMAVLTLQEKANVIAGRPLTDPATNIERIAAAIGKLGGDVAGEQLTPAHPVFTNHPVTQAQLDEWASMAVNMQIHPRMTHNIIDSPTINLADDANIVVESRKVIWCYAHKLGSA